MKAAVAQHKGRRIGEEKLLRKTLCTLAYLLGVAKSRAPVCYEDISINCGLGTARWANIAFSPIEKTFALVRRDPRFPCRDIPDISTIVTHKGKDTAGDGVLTGYPGISDKTLEEKTRLVLRERDRARNWHHWAELAAFLDIAPFHVLAPSPERLTEFEHESRQHTGKSPEHQAMQDWILSDPHSVGVGVHGEIDWVGSKSEYAFWSLDRLDVIVKTNVEWIGFEVKPVSASVDELRKGIYQAVKYASLIRADLLDHGQVKCYRCVLVVGGNLTPQLAMLAERLQVQTVENFKVA